MPFDDIYIPAPVFGLLFVKNIYHVYLCCVKVMCVEYKYSRFIFFNLHSHLQRYKVFDIRAPIFRSFLIFFFAFFFPNKAATG